MLYDSLEIQRLSDNGHPFWGAAALTVSAEGEPGDSESCYGELLRQPNKHPPRLYQQQCRAPR